MSINNRMIDSLMGSIPDDQLRDSDLSGRKIKKTGTFTDITNKMLWESYKLKKMAEEDIPQAFPLSPPKSGRVPGFHHTRYEMFDSGFSTEIEDGMYSIEVVTKMYTVFVGLQLLIDSLFPKNISNGVWDIEIMDQFESAKENISESIATIRSYLSDLRKNLDSSKMITVDRTEMRKLKKHVTRLGYDCVKNSSVPAELLRKEGGVTLPQVAREWQRMRNLDVSPVQMEQLLLDSEGEKNRKKESTDMLSDYIEKQVRKRRGER